MNEGRVSTSWMVILLVVPTAVLTLTRNTHVPTAFTKGLTANLYVTSGEKISFNREITSHAANFDSVGSFVCKTPGLYSFTFYGLAEEDSRLWLELMRNTELIASIFAYTSNDYADAGNAAIVYLNVNDQVYVKANNNYRHTLYGRADQIYTTFTGELLFADDNSELVVDNFIRPVGFSAALTINSTFSGGSTLIYNKPITNIGNGYNSATGTFTAPVEGNYVFHFNSLAYNGHEFWLELFHNYQYIVSSYGYTSGDFADAGNTVILHLRRGDVIRIKARPGRDARLYGDIDEFYTTFCGALLSPSLHGSGHNLQKDIAFSVGLAKNENSGSNTKIVFDKVFLNNGNGYSTTTGVFRAPTTGTYVFHYHALAQQGEREWVELYHNYKYINSLYAHTSGGYGPGSNSAVLDLHYGESVYLSIKNHSSYLYGGSDNIYCTFSGYLL